MLPEVRKPYRVLVFPCGSEIGLEVADSLKYNKHFQLIGVSSQPDHGRFIYEYYHEITSTIYEDACIDELKELIQSQDIDLVYPTMDLVLYRLMANEAQLGIPVVSSPLETTEICLSKKKTYTFLKEVIRTPQIITDSAQVTEFPIFAKPDVGYGSRGARILSNREELHRLMESENSSEIILTEYLPGKEYTVDCLTDKNGALLFAGARERGRISNGISVSSATSDTLSKRFLPLAEDINQKLVLRGAWFFQLKEAKNGEIALLEVASRLAGTSSVHRVQGINFALLSCYVALNLEITIVKQNFHVQVDRALSRRVLIDFHFDFLYVDLDDTIIVNDQVNCDLVSFIYACRNRQKRILLITRHRYNVDETLKKYALDVLFDEVIHLRNDEKKHAYIKHKSAIFIDDSFAERQDVYEQLGIPVFSPESLPHFLF